MFGMSGKVAREGLTEKVAIEFSEGTNDMIICRQSLMDGGAANVEP